MKKILKELLIGSWRNSMVDSEDIHDKRENNFAFSLADNCVVDSTWSSLYENEQDIQIVIREHDLDGKQIHPYVQLAFLEDQQYTVSFSSYSEIMSLVDKLLDAADLAFGQEI